MILIAAHGRSGTHYTAAVLQAVGLDMPHEVLGKDGTVSWKHIAPGEFVVIGKQRTQTIPVIDFTHIIHQVRHPLAVIASSQTFSESTWAYMEQRLGLPPLPARKWPSPGSGPFSIRDKRRPALIRRGMRTWLGWNGLIESRAEWRFQIERLDELFPELLTRIGLPPRPVPDVPRSRQDSRRDRKGHRPVSCDDLYAADATLAEQLVEMARRYGYDIR